MKSIVKTPEARTALVSYGGFVSLKLAAHAPDRIDRFVLLVPAGVVGGPVLDGFFKLALPMLMYRAFPSEKRLTRFVQNLLRRPATTGHSTLARPSAVSTSTCECRRSPGPRNSRG